MTRYLYGAAIQGIQEFIFQTNKLQEIAGASELIENICTEFFTENCHQYKEDNQIVSAAGNIKYIFDNEYECKQFVLNFPKQVMKKAPGITVSQAVVKYAGTQKLSDTINQLELKLKAQRNKASIPIETGFSILARSRRTGGVGVCYEVKGGTSQKEVEVVDNATKSKLKENKARKLVKKFSGIESVEYDDIAFNFENITKDSKNKWLAVIHADGNGVGGIVQSFGNLDLNDQQLKSEFRKFSLELEKSTNSATKRAFEEVIKKGPNGYPVRPIIQGGDDITLVIRGDLALEFTSKYLEFFEDECQKNLGFLGDHELPYKLTACAGIAYIKESYPFHYGVDLAEKLCKEAKAFSKNEDVFGKGMPPSSLSFYKVQESFIEADLKDLRARTMLVENTIDYSYGPYLINDNDRKPENHTPTISELNDLLKKIFKAENISDKSKPISKLRQLISESLKNPATTKFMMDRMLAVNKKFCEEINLEQNFNIGSSEKSILNDLIQLHSIINK